ncbi:hypothetical protein DL767_000021 [Monosporascus sp. MG133]|nr:hypothetical protein DL767_000021 [Monosporascus sp. MG133]
MRTAPAINHNIYNDEVGTKYVIPGQPMPKFGSESGSDRVLPTGDASGTTSSGPSAVAPTSTATASSVSSTEPTATEPDVTETTAIESATPGSTNPSSPAFTKGCAGKKRCSKDRMH